jgi:hypothetical protein
VHACIIPNRGVFAQPLSPVPAGSGRFTLPPLPPGTYTIEIWHERLGTETQQITVAAKDTKDMTFSFKVS